MDVETKSSKFGSSMKIPSPKELMLVWDEKECKISKILIDGIEIPFRCVVEVKNQIMMLGDVPVSASREIILTIYPERLVVRKEDDKQ